MLRLLLDSHTLIWWLNSFPASPRTDGEFERLESPSRPAISENF